jgi:hypothetical protein
MRMRTRKLRKERREKAGDGGNEERKDSRENIVGGKSGKEENGERRM